MIFQTNTIYKNITEININMFKHLINMNFIKTKTASDNIDVEDQFSGKFDLNNL
jgi:hypothetical protein